MEITFEKKSLVVPEITLCVFERGQVQSKQETKAIIQRDMVS